MKKRLSCLALAALLSAGSVLTAQAKDQEGKDGWKAEFTGKSIESNFSSQSLADEISGMLPGDSVKIRIAVSNTSGGNTDWYMSNEVLQSMEDNSPANGGAYRYELVYERDKEETVLYSSDSVGGESVTAAGEGLHEATDNLEQFFYLDHLKKGEQGYITLTVALNGETHGNGYQNTLARLQLNFAVEKTGGGGGGSDKTVLTPGGTSVIYSPRAVQTGDPGGMVFWSVIALVSGLALLICGLMYQRNRGGREYE